MYEIYTAQELLDNGSPVVMDQGGAFARMSAFLNGRPFQLCNWQYSTPNPTDADRKAMSALMIPFILNTAAAQGGGELKFVEGMHFWYSSSINSNVVLIDDVVTPQIYMPLVVNGLTVSGFPTPATMSLKLHPYQYFADTDIPEGETEVTLDLTETGKYTVGFVPTSLADIIYMYTSVDIDYQAPPP